MFGIYGLRRCFRFGTRRSKGLICALGLAVALSGVVTPAGTISEAKASPKLSFTKKTYDFTSVWDKIKLKNVPSGSKIVWKSSNTNVLKIKSKINNGTWYKVCRSGSSTITAKYRGKVYRCKVKVKDSGVKSTSTPKPTTKPVVDDPDADTTDITGAYLNATDITLYFCEKELREYIHTDDHPLEFQFKVYGTDLKPTWRVKYDGVGLNITSDGLLSFADGWFGESKEATVIARFSNTKKLTAHVKLVSEGALIYKAKIADFYDRYITDGMSTYEKVDAVCKYTAHEYDYVAYRSDWYSMVVSGGGDCMASRIGVLRLCNEMGIPAYACGIDDHGMCMVNVDGEVYMSVTGFNVAKPRPYMLYKMSEEGLAKMLEKYPVAKSYLKI